MAQRYHFLFCKVTKKIRTLPVIIILELKEIIIEILKQLIDKIIGFIIKQSTLNGKFKSVFYLL